MDDIHTERKKHKERQSGVKAEKKKAKVKPDPNLTPIQRNPKAFSVQHAQKTARYAQRSQEIKNKKHHIPLVDRTPLDPPPVIIGVVGPPKVGKTTLLQGIVKNYAKQKLTNVQGPVTIVSGKKRRLTLMECNNDINSMIDIAKVADLVLLLVDASFGFEMETFEFLNICQVHGFPKIMGVLTHLDRYKDNKKMRKMKKRFKHRFWTEVYAGAKLFYLSGMVYGEYPKQQVFNLCRFISVMKFRPLTWRTTHPYILADRMEDITDPETVRKNEKTDRNVSVYGYVHGTMMKNNVNIHIPGCGDFSINEIQLISDPCPTPDKEKKVRSLTQKDRIIYAPMSGVGGIVYDKDAVYIDVAGQQSQTGEQEQQNPSNELVSSLMGLSNTLDEKISASDVAMFSESTEKSRTVGRVLCESPAVKFVQTADGRFRRLAVFDDETKGKEEKSPADDDNDDESDDDDDDNEDEQEDDEDEMDSEEEEDLEDPIEPPRKKHKMETPKMKDKMEKVPNEDLAYADTDDEMADISIFSTSTVATPKPSNKLVLTPGQSIKSDNSDDSIDYDNDSSDDEIDSDNEINEKDTSSKSGNSKSPLINKSSIEGSSKNTSAKSKSPSLSTGSQKKMSGDRKSGDKKEYLGEVEDSSDEESSESESDEDNILGGDEKKDNSSQSAKGKSPALTSSSQKIVSTAKKDLSDSDGSSSDSGDDESDSDGDETMELLPCDNKSPVLSSSAKKKVLSKEEDMNIKDSKSPVSSSSSKKNVSVKEDDSGGEESGSDSEDESEHQEDEDEEDFDDETMDDFDSGDASIRWKSNLAEEAAASFRARQASRKNYRKIIYGEEVIEGDQTEADTDEIGGLFRIIKEKNEKTKQARVGIDRTDCSKRQKSTVKDLSLDQLREAIADCFVTGKWDQSNDAEAQLNMDDELYGDFEDLETGEKHAAVDKDKVKREEDSAMDNADAAENSEETTQRKTKAEMTADERRAEKKRKLKEMFNAQYDDKGSTDFYDAWKAQTEQQAQMNRSEFEDLDDDIRVQYEGYRPGMYVCVEINNVPCELVTNFDPTYPLILGGLLSGESNIGYVQTRFKKHRWHKKILKTKNPLIVSLGWRRFQSIPIYSIQDHNMRNRLLKYTPEHLHCHASLWGPITPQGTGLLAVESVSGTQPGFRIAGTGVVLELDKSMQIVKKLKLTGTPNKIYKKTAFIEGMFNSSLEVSKFEGASIRTVSGIRGQIKKAMSNPEGCYRATFEDQIVMGDIVFLRSWFPVEVPQFYNPVTSLLLPKGDKQTWTGMKTLGQLQYERSLKPDNNQDSTYKEIVRPKKTYNPLVIPKNLKKNLPFKVTPKEIKPQDSIDRIAVVREPHEKKIAKVLKMMKTLHEHKQLLDHQRNVERVRKHQKEAGKIWDSKTRKQKERKKSYFKKLVRNPKLAYQS